MFASILWTLVAMSSACELSEFDCNNGNCVALSRYCDGSDDCGDASDEPSPCTNCNRTYYGQTGIKYPFRMTEPFHRHQPFVCQLTFVASGESYGDFVEITFLSFHVGVFLLQRSNCHQGHMEVTESSVGGGNGQFCGKMIGPKVAFYSTGGNATIRVIFPSLTSTHTFSPSLYLTYRFLAERSRQMDDRQYHYGDPLSGCDRIFRDCDSRECRIRSPNYPGFYLRNMTCRYVVKQSQSPSGQVGQISLYQDNEYKINLFSGYKTTEAYKNTRLTSDCRNDLIRVYDGEDESHPVLAEFCGSGPLPEIRSSGPGISVVLHSAPYQPLHDSKFELNVRITFVDALELRMRDGRCEFSLPAGSTPHRSGLVHAPYHTLPPNSTCSFRIRGRHQQDLIWLYFVSYYSPDLHGWSSQEKCDVASLEIYDPHLGGQDTSLIGRFCEKSSPRMCLHAGETVDNIPYRPCRLPGESYLSHGPELVLRYAVYPTSEVLASKGTFRARYEIINTRQSGIPLGGSNPCGRRFISAQSRRGVLHSPQNLLLYGRGGSQNISCNYVFEGSLDERVRLTFTELRLGSEFCISYFDEVSWRYACNLELAPEQAFLNVTEVWNALPLNLGCLCGSTARLKTPMTLESVGNQVNMNFVVTGMSPLQDYNDFGFHAHYEFLHPSGCAVGSLQRVNGSGGVVEVTGHNDSSLLPRRCRWMIETQRPKFLYVAASGTNAAYGCRGRNRAVIYDGSNGQVMAGVCADSGSSYELFTKGWSESSSRVERSTDAVVVETFVFEEGQIRFQWLEVVKPYVMTLTGETLPNRDCANECPELRACISAELWCDGTRHCPSGHDEVPDECRKFPFLYVAVGTGSPIILLTLVIVLCIAHRRRHRERKTHCEEIQMDVTPSRPPR